MRQGKIDGSKGGGRWEQGGRGDCWEEGSRLLGLLLKKHCAVASNKEHCFFKAMVK